MRAGRAGGWLAGVAAGAAPGGDRDPARHRPGAGGGRRAAASRRATRPQRCRASSRARMASANGAAGDSGRVVAAAGALGRRGRRERSALQRVRGSLAPVRGVLPRQPTQGPEHWLSFSKIAGTPCRRHRLDEKPHKLRDPGSGRFGFVLLIVFLILADLDGRGGAGGAAVRGGARGSLPALWAALSSSRRQTSTCRAAECFLHIRGFAFTTWTQHVRRSVGPPNAPKPHSFRTAGDLSARVVSQGSS